VRAPVDSIYAPPLPQVPWVNVATLRMDKQVGRPVLVEFWDFLRINSLRTIPYLNAWHDRYADRGLRIIGVHAPGFPPSRDADAVRAAVASLGIEHPVALDPDLQIWRQYEVPGWPARYLFDQKLRLVEYHHGEGDYAGTERAIQELLGIEEPLMQPVRPEDDPDALLVIPTPDQPGAWSGPYAAGGAWAVVDGRGTLAAGDRAIPVDGPACVAVAEHPRHTEAVLELTPGPGVVVHATCFTAGLS
jgi:thiol-disulfide isomerase/thioredoxin